MKVRNFIFGSALVVATALITTQVVSQDHKGGQAGGAPPGMPEFTPDEQEVMAVCTALGSPAEKHKVLQSHVGKWNGSMTMWITPESKPMTSTFQSEAKWIYDGRFVHQTVEGQMMPGQTFQGQSFIGYDNAENKYFSTWMDNMSTALMVSKGKYDEAKKSFAYTANMFCPLAKKEVSTRTTEKWTDNDHYTMEMFAPWHKTGKEYKMMEITYTRAK
jgi:hypothetical protein